MLELAIGIILAGCGIGAGLALIAGIGPGSLRSHRSPAREQKRRNFYHDFGLCHRGNHRSLWSGRRHPAHLRRTQYVCQHFAQRHQIMPERGDRERPNQ